MKAIDLLKLWNTPPYPVSIEDNIEAIDSMIEKILIYLAEKEGAISTKLIPAEIVAK